MVAYRSAVKISSTVSICCCLDTSVDLWVMRRMAPVLRIPSDPSMSHLARDDRPSRRTSSSLSDRFPRRPYYRFYYGPRIVAEDNARFLPSWCRWSRSGGQREPDCPPRSRISLAALRPSILAVCVLPEWRSSSRTRRTDMPLGMMPRSYCRRPSLCYDHTLT